MENDDHKNTWNNFTKFVLWGTVAVIGVLVLAWNFFEEIKKNNKDLAKNFVNIKSLEKDYL